MRRISPGPVVLAESDSVSLRFRGQRGEYLAVSVLDQGLIRVQHLPDGMPRLNRTWLVVGRAGDMPREGRRRDDLTPFDLPGFDWTAGGGAFHLQTTELRLDINTRDFGIRWLDTEGRLFAADLKERAYCYDGSGQIVFHTMERRLDEHYYGFGEKAGPLDKAGLRMRMVNVDALGYDAQNTDPLYKHWPFYITLVPDLHLAYGLFYDNLSDTVFDMGKEVNALHGGPYRYYQAAAGDLDYYLIHGPTIELVLERFAALTGRPMLPPRWSLGYLGSTMSYTEAPDAQNQLRQFVELCDRHEIPCDMFHLSSGYTTDTTGRRCVFTWNHDRVPDPHAMVDNFHQAGIRLAANIKPYLLRTHPRFDEVAAQGGFIKAAASDEPELGAFWSGGVFEFDEGAYIDFTSPSGYEWWRASVTSALLGYGIDAIWNDNNEFEVRDDAARCDGFGDSMEVALARPLLTLLMAHASTQAMRDFHPDQRPFLLSRSGCPGIQRYAQTWSGDNATSWHTLRYNIPMGLGLSLSGMPNTGHDVGGFTGPKPDAELFVRWVQNGIFHPRFTIHSWNSDGTVNEAWMYPDVLPIVREAITFRYRLLPYLYALVFEAAQTGHPIIRPLVYHFPDDPQCRVESFDFMVGPNLLVASVLEAGARARSVYLPAGRDWYDFYTGQHYTGGQIVPAEAPLERTPLFAPTGGIIPMGKPMRHVGEQPDDLRQAYCFPSPGNGHGAFRLFEDDGISLAYQRGTYSVVRLDMNCSPTGIILGARSDQDGYPLPYSSIEFIFPPGEARAVQSAPGGDRWTDGRGRRHVVVPVSA